MSWRWGENAQMGRYADDIVILSDFAESKLIMNVLEHLLGELGLELSVEKSRVTTAAEGFDFLSFHFIRRYRGRFGKW